MSEQQQAASLAQSQVSASTIAEVAPRLESRQRTTTATDILRRRILPNLSLALIYLFLAIMTIFALFPVYFVVQASLAGAQNLYTTDLKLLPSNPTFDNYIYAITKLPLLAWLGNTLIVCGLSTLIGLTFATTAAYALSRFRFSGRELSLTALLTLQAFPALLALTAYYLLLDALNLLDNLLGIALIYTAWSLVFGCWNIKGYFDTLPIELEQAALVDGASHFQAFWRITLPLALPALAASGLLMFITGWNEFAVANLMLNSNEAGTDQTFILGLQFLQGNFRTPWGYFAASSVLISLPLIALFLYAQRFFKSGLTIGSVKG